MEAATFITIVKNDNFRRSNGFSTKTGKSGSIPK